MRNDKSCITYVGTHDEAANFSKNSGYIIVRYRSTAAPTYMYPRSLRKYRPTKKVIRKYERN